MATMKHAGKGVKNIFVRVMGTKKTSLSMRMGVLGGATNPETGEKVASYAIENEYGNLAEGIPSRPALRLTAQNNKDEYAKIIADRMKSGFTAEQAMHVVGQTFKADFARTIQSKPWRDNSEKTKARKRAKGRAEPLYPLIDSGAYIKSIDYEIDNESS